MRVPKPRPMAGLAIIPGAGSVSLCQRLGPVALQIFQSIRDHSSHFPGRGDAMQIIDWSLGRGEEPSGKDHAMQTADPSPGSREECSGPRAAPSAEMEILRVWSTDQQHLHHLGAG